MEGVVLSRAELARFRLVMGLMPSKKFERLGSTDGNLDQLRTKVARSWPGLAGVAKMRLMAYVERPFGN